MTTSPNPSPAEIVAAFQRGGIVEALKLVLAAKGASARHERKVVGRIAAQVEASKPLPLSGANADLSPGEVPRSNSGIWLLFLIATLCIGYYVFGR